MPYVSVTCQQYNLVGDVGEGARCRNAATIDRIFFRQSRGYIDDFESRIIGRIYVVKTDGKQHALRHMQIPYANDFLSDVRGGVTADTV